MLKETYKANLRNIPKNAVTIEVTRVRGHPLSPSWKLLDDYKQNRITWEVYERRFKIEMDNDLCKDAMKEIKELSRFNEVYLVCYEKRFPCHRFLLIDMINQME